MSIAGAAETVYVLPVPRVRESITHLLERDTHQFFIAYLHLRRLAAKQGSTTGLSPSWAELGRVLETPGSPSPGKPYLRPFWKGQRGSGQEWLNENLAGSYAPSSLRGVPMQVVETDARGRFNLREDHWRLAFHHLLYDLPISALAIAGFVFRDYGILTEVPPGPRDIISLFRTEYGYGGEDDEFNHLYDVAWLGAGGPWSELLVTEPDE